MKTIQISTFRSIPTEVVLTEADGLPNTCAANFDNLQTVPKSQIGNRIAHLTSRKMFEAVAVSTSHLNLNLISNIDYLNYDRLSKTEVHTQLPDGGKQMQWFIAQHRIRPQLHLSRHDEHESRLFALAERLDREPDQLLKNALEDLLSTQEAKTFGSLLATQPTPDNDRPLIHARKLESADLKPLCGATDGPWGARGFEFLRLTCHDCQSLVLEPREHPA